MIKLISLRTTIDHHSSENVLSIMLILTYFFYIAILQLKVLSYHIYIHVLLIVLFSFPPCCPHSFCYLLILSFCAHSAAPTLFIYCWLCHFVAHSAAPTPARTSSRKAYRPQWTGKPSKKQQYMIRIEAWERKRKENDPQCPTDHPELGRWFSCFFFLLFGNCISEINFYLCKITRDKTEETPGLGRQWFQVFFYFCKLLKYTIFLAEITHWATRILSSKQTLTWTNGSCRVLLMSSSLSARNKQT